MGSMGRILIALSVLVVIFIFSCAPPPSSTSYSYSGYGQDKTSYNKKPDLSFSSLEEFEKEVLIPIVHRSNSLKEYIDNLRRKLANKSIYIRSRKEHIALKVLSKKETYETIQKWKSSAKSKGRYKLVKKLEIVQGDIILGIKLAIRREGKIPIRVLDNEKKPVKHVPKKRLIKAYTILTSYDIAKIILEEYCENKIKSFKSYLCLDEVYAINNIPAAKANVDGKVGVGILILILRPISQTKPKSTIVQKPKSAPSVKSTSKGTPSGQSTKSVSTLPSDCPLPSANNYLFAVVVYNYKEIGKLEYVKNDKEIIRKLAACYMGVPEVNMKIIENPSYAELKRELLRFAKRIKKHDARLYFYYSGHGILDSKGKFYILPADASIEDEEALRESGVNINTLKRLLSRAKGKKVAFIDACRIDPPWKPAVVVYEPKLSDIAMVFSTKQGQLSNVDKDKRYSAFTRALYEMASSGLVNLDFDDDGYVEIKELIRPLTKWVRKVSADGKQTPDVWGPKDFEIFPVE